MQQGDWAPPAVFEGYRVVRPLGSGGMGSVYLAHDVLLDRAVAIKFLSDAGNGPTRRQRFQLEGRALARLNHPNVVATHRVGEIEGRPFLVSEFVEGQSLDRHPIPMPWLEVIELGIGICRGLAAAHRAGILHRDLKPANVVLGADGHPRLIDFGVAKLVDDAPPEEAAPATVSSSRSTSTEAEGDEVLLPVLSRAGSIAGTPAYLPPERLRGEPATFRSDVYGVGRILAELLIGAPAEPRLAAIIARAIEADPARRFATAQALLEALLSLQDEVVELGAVPEGNPYPGLRPFEAGQRTVFLGRTAEARMLVERLKSQALVVVAGDSGVGKSSLCRAGVLPLIAAGALKSSWATLTFVPALSPVSELAALLSPLLESESVLVEQWLREEPVAIARRLAEQKKRMVLLVDPLETLLTQAPGDAAAQLARAFASWAESASSLKVLCTVRADSLTALFSLPELGQVIAANTVFIRPLGPEHLREVVVAPARRTGVHFENEAMVDALVRSALSSETSLPLLQFTLAELWERRDVKRQRISLATLEQMGGVEGALEHYADARLDALEPAALLEVRDTLLRLVTSQGTRARVAEAGIVHRAALEMLIRARLVAAVSGPQGTSYELSHEALIRGWTRLRQWLDEEGDRRRLVERLSVAAQEWNRSGRSRSGLWGRRQLEEVSSASLRVSSGPDLDFLAASRGAVRRQRLTRIGAPLLVVVLAGVVLLGARVRANSEVRAASDRHADQAHVASVATTQLEEDLRGARAHALQSFDAAMTGRSEIATADQEWADVLSLERRVDDAWVKVTAELEAALLLQPADVGLRSELVTVLRSRQALSTLFNRERSASEIGERLRTLEGTTDAQVKTSKVTLTTEPADATLRFEQWSDRRWQMVTHDTNSGFPPGSYRVRVSAPEHATTWRPFVVRVDAPSTLTVRLPPGASVPEGYEYVAVDSFLSGSDDEAFRVPFENAPLHEVGVEPFVIARQEVTFAEYLAWLDTLPAAQRRERQPQNERLSVERKNGTWWLTFTPGHLTYRVAWGKPLEYLDRTLLASQDWRAFPVLAISFDDALAYTAWLDRSGRVPGARLCNAKEWEVAARGVDGRRFTTGASLYATEANFDATYARKPDAFGPDAVGSHRESDSPFGLSDCEGNALEIVSSQRLGEPTTALGGSWYYERVSARLDNRFPIVATTRSAELGFRVCASAPAVK